MKSLCKLELTYRFKCPGLIVLSAISVRVSMAHKVYSVSCTRRNLEAALTKLSVLSMSL